MIFIWTPLNPERCAMYYWTLLMTTDAAWTTHLYDYYYYRYILYCLLRASTYCMLRLLGLFVYYICLVA
jgi:hypothetical protein